MSKAARCYRCCEETPSPSSRAPFPLTALPDEIASLVVDHVPLRAMARLALTNTDWAERVQRSLRREEPWSRSYIKHRCCHDLTVPARTKLEVPNDCWGWQEHLNVLDAIAVRQHPAELVWFVEGLVSSEWWQSRYFDEEAVGRALTHSLVGRGQEGGNVSAYTVLQLYEVFAKRRNPSGCVVHCVSGAAAIVGAHTPECGGFCAEHELATRAWSLRSLARPLGGSDDAAAVGLCLQRAALSAEHAAYFLLNYAGSVFELWDLTTEDASTLARLASELKLDGSTMASLIGRLAEEEATHQSAVEQADEAGAAEEAADADAELPAASDEPFACTCTLLREWAETTDFPGAWPMPERMRVFSTLSAQKVHKGFKEAAAPVLLEWVARSQAAQTEAAANEAGASGSAAGEAAAGERLGVRGARCCSGPSCNVACSTPCCPA